MTRRSRTKKDTTGVARHTSVARSSAATSHDWTDLSSTYQQAAPAVRRALRAHLRRQAKGLIKAPTRLAKAVSFGTWTLPPTIPKKRLQQVTTCVRRHQRRQVLFATRSTGAGSRGRRLHFTNRRC